MLLTSFHAVRVQNTLFKHHTQLSGFYQPHECIRFSGKLWRGNTSIASLVSNLTFCIPWKLYVIYCLLFFTEFIFCYFFPFFFVQCFVLWVFRFICDLKIYSPIGPCWSGQILHLYWYLLEACSGHHASLSHVAPTQVMANEKFIIILNRFRWTTLRAKRLGHEAN